MEYLEESQILLYEELCGNSIKEDKISLATIRFRENINLVYYVVHKFSTPYDPDIDKEDILQEAYLGLWKACLAYDEGRGLKFSTFAVPYIRGNILVCLRENEAISTPRSFKDIRSALIRHGFTLPLNNEEIDTLVSEGRLSRYQILEYAEPEIVCLDSPIKYDSENTYSEIIPSTDIPLECRFDEDEIEKIIDRIISYIKPKYRDLVEEWMYSVLVGVKVTQSILGIKYGFSQTHVQRILSSAVSILKMHGDEIRDLFGI